VLHAPPIFLLDLITRTIFGEQYRSVSSSLCSFLHSSVVLRRPKYRGIFLLLCPYWPLFINFPTARFHLRRLSWSPK
jgi:hypothetical protein